MLSRAPRRQGNRNCDGSSARLDLGLRCRDSEPRAYDPLDRPKLRGRKSSQASDQLGVRNCYKVLGVEYTRTQERNPNRHFESGTPRTRRVRYEGHERAVVVVRRYADDHGRSDLGGHSEVHQPDLAPLRGFHLRLLVAIEFDEEVIRGRNQIIVLGQIVRSEGCSTEQFRDEFRPVFVRQGVEFVQQLLCSLRHTFRLALDVVGVKFLW